MVENSETQKKDSEIDSNRKPLFNVNPYSIVRFFGLFLIIVSLGFYLSWNILYNDWGDIGMYSFVAPTIVFGILAVALGFEKEKEKK